jgi:pimeloyl-ACP methyl ester carboxylesterase
MADAVVVPGRMFGPAGGLLMYAGLVAERRQATVHRHTWSQEPPAPDVPEIERWVAGEVTPLLDEAGGRPLLIAKSLGTNAAGLAAGRSLPAVWLTPLLTVPWVAAALGRATAPFLLVGGTADEVWDSAVARRLSPHVLEVDGADHGMCVPGPVTRSIAVLGQVVAAMDEFLGEIGWPDSAVGSRSQVRSDDGQAWLNGRP